MAVTKQTSFDKETPCPIWLSLGKCGCVNENVDFKLYYIFIKFIGTYLHMQLMDTVFDSAAVLHET